LVPKSRENEKTHPGERDGGEMAVQNGAVRRGGTRASIDKSQRE